MTWRTFTSEAVAGYPAVLEVRPITVGEWRKVEQLDDDARQAFVLESCTRVDGVPGSTALDMHVATALIQGVMANPWNGPRQTA
jgi:hypothetical protein